MVNTLSRCYPLVALAASVVLISCNKDDGNSGSREVTAEITSELMEEVLANIETVTTKCVSNAPKENSQTAAADVPVVRSVSMALAAGSAQNVTGEGTYAGNCPDAPGSLSITQASHEHGVTTLSVLFSDYCSISASDERSVLNGNATYIEHGEPSDSGPIVSKRTGNTDGNGLQLMRYAADGTTKLEDKTIVLTDYTLTYGTPYNYFYGHTAPSESAPDKTEFKTLEITDNLNNIKTTLTDMSATVYESVPGSASAEQVVSITKGVVSFGESGTASVATEAGKPLVINAANSIVSGAVVLTGASGSATLTVDGENTATVEVDGEPLTQGTAIDCGNFKFDELFVG